MKETWKRVLGLLLSALLLTGGLSACGKEDGPDPVQGVLGYSGDTVYFTVNGKDVTAQDYLLWLVQEIDYIDSAYIASGQEGVNWEEDLGGVTAGEYLKEQIMETAKLVEIMSQLAEESNVSFDEADRQAYDEELEQVIEQQGGQETYDRYLLEMCITDESMASVSRASVLYGKMTEELFAEGGAFELTEERLQQEITDRDIMRAKHILLLTSEPELDGVSYSAAEIAAQQQLAQDLLTQIQNSEDRDATFDSLMYEYSQDTGLADNPDGYVFTSMPDGVLFTRRMDKTFETTAASLQVGEMSGVVGSQSGLHIILRLDPLEDASFRAQFVLMLEQQGLDELLQTRLSEAEVVTTPTYDALDVRAFYEALQAYRVQLAGEDETDGSGDTSDDGSQGEAPVTDGTDGTDVTEPPSVPGQETPTDPDESVPDPQETPSE